MPPDPLPDFAAPEREPLHRLIARTLRAEITAGQPPIGGLLAGEHELCERFGASRHTVREALRALSRDGLIERRQGAGTRILADQPRGPHQLAMHSVDELRHYAAETVLRIDSVAIGPLSADEAALLGDHPPQRWLRTEGVRWNGAEALCSNRAFIDPRYAPLLADLRPGAVLTSSMNEMVASRSGKRIVTVEQDILARPMPKGATGLHAGPALLFVRRYRDAAEQVMVWSLNWHPAARFVYRMRVHPA